MNRPRFRSWFHEFRAWVFAGGAVMLSMCLTERAEPLAVAFLAAAVVRLMAFYGSLS